MIEPFIKKVVPAHMHNPASRGKNAGQILVIFAILLPVIIFFVALGLDMSLVYLTKSKLSRAVDGVALRVAHQFSNEDEDAERRREIALTYMQANMRGFLNGIDKDSNAWSVTGSVTNTSGETQTVTYNGETLEINTKASSAHGAITVTVSASTKHKTFFMRMAGPSFEEFNFTENATATRYPAVNILVLDMSGSMLSNGGDEGLIEGVQDFMREFDESRDYMLIIGFSDRACVLWPNVEYNYGDSHTDSSGYGIATGIDSSVGPITGLHYYKPSRDFKTGLNGNSAYAYDAIISDAKMSYTGYTNGAEGLRLGAEFLNKWLQNEIPDSIRDELQINIIFFTDGEFNTVRSYVKGPGYGTSLSSRSTDDTYSPSRRSVHNTFHDYSPLVGENLNVSYGGKNLSTIFGSYSTAGAMPGINACYNGGNLPTRSSVEWKENTSTGGSQRSRWANMFYFPYRSYAYWKEAAGGTWSGDIAAALKPGSNKTDQFRATGFLLTDSIQNRINSSTTKLTAYNSVDNTVFQGEQYKLAYCDYLFVPVSVTNQYTNACNGVSYTSTVSRNGYTYYPLPAEVYTYWANASNTKSNKAFDYFPVSRVFTNHYDSYFYDNDGSDAYAPSKSKFSWIYERTSGSTRKGWFRAAARLEDFYLDYTIGGQPDFNGDINSSTLTEIGDPYSSEGSGNMNDNVSGRTETGFVSGDSDHQPYVYRWWKFSNSSWTNSSTSVDSEAYWLTQAQGYLLRTQFDATIYTIVYGSNGSTSEMKKLANDPSSSSYDASQNEGKFYQTGEDADQLSEVFADIARRIAVKLTD